MQLKPTVLSLILLISIPSIAQINLKITDTTVVAKYTSEIKKLNLTEDSVFYEDSIYKVKATCQGEWGGSVWFYNKKTKIEYSTESTCPVVINKLNNRYYITSSLAHLIGFTEIVEIDNPDSLSVFVMPKPIKKRGKVNAYHIGDHQSKSKQGTKTIVDSVGILTLYSFIHRQNLLHIVVDFQNTYLCKIERNNYVVLDTIANYRIRSFRNGIKRTPNNEIVLLFDYDERQGYIRIKEDEIELKQFVKKINDPLSK